jgi:hypothetical protein
VLVLGGTQNAVRDPKGDSRAGHADIASATESVSSTSFTWTIKAYGAFSTAKAPCVDVQSVQPSGIEWAICGGAAHGFGVSTSSPYQAGGGYAGRAVVTRPNRSTIVYRVPRKSIAIGANLNPRPKSFAWQIQVRDQPGCYPAICDRAPDAVRVLLRR